MEETSQVAAPNTNRVQEPEIDTSFLVPEFMPPEEVPNLMPNIKTGFRFTLEPILLLIFLGFSINQLVQTNLFEERMCLHSELGQNKSIDCFNMTTAELEQIQPSVANLKMFKNLIEILVPSVTMLFLGSWSDINGRLPLFLYVISGMVVTNCMFCVLSTIPELPPVTFLLCSIPIALTGGNGALLIASFCYIVDITEHKSRAFRICILQTCISLGSIIGSFLSPLLYSKSVTYSIALSSMATLAALLYTSHFLKETVIAKKDASRKLYNLKLVKDTWKSVVKKRSGFLRSIVVLSAVTLGLNVVIVTGENLLRYMYLQKQFSWSLQDYTLFDAYSSFLNVI